MRKYLFLSVFTIIAALYISGCSSVQGNGNQAPPPPQTLPVLQINVSPATTYLEYQASIEGTTNVEIRPQVSGYLDKIYIEEGAYVSKGQLLFKINDREYNEQSNNAGASIELARADVEKAKVEVDRLKPLVDNKVIADVQLQTAVAEYNAAKATLERAVSAKGSTDITLGYTLIKAPVNGYIGRIPYKIGSLIGRNETQALTILSDIKNVYAYFSISESDFLRFTNQVPGKTINDKIKNLPPVELQLSDRSIYASKGKVELMEGQFDKNTGTISFRAVFPNAEGVLRSGNSGKVRIPQINTGLLPVPQTATYEIQDKIFVFAVGDSNKVISSPLHIVRKTTDYYLVDKGVQAGDKIVFAGMDRLQDGAVINPQILSADSLLKVMPL